MASGSRTQPAKAPVEIHILLSHELRFVIAAQNARRRSPAELGGSLSHTQFETNPPPRTKVSNDVMIDPLCLGGSADIVHRVRSKLLRAGIGTGSQYGDE